MRLRMPSIAFLAIAIPTLGCEWGAGATSDSPVTDAGTTVDASPGAVDASHGVQPTDASTIATDASSSDAAPVVTRQSLIWVWQGYGDALDAIAANARSFTHVSPALYQVNYDYASGPAKLVSGNDDFDGLRSRAIADRIHAAGLACVPLVYAGAGNYGTDKGIQNILNDSPAGAKDNFITAMVNEAVTKGYDGYNLDWEVSETGYSGYGKKLVSFLSAFRSALNAHHMTLSLDVAGWYVKQCTGSGGDGLVDLSAIGQSVDLAIFEDYAGSLGAPASACGKAGAGARDCDKDFAGALDVMCLVPPETVSIGLISPGTNRFAAEALAAAAAYGYSSVAVWPDDSVFLNASGMPSGATWYSALAAFLAH